MGRAWIQETQKTIFKANLILKCNPTRVSKIIIPVRVSLITITRFLLGLHPAREKNLICKLKLFWPRSRVLRIWKLWRTWWARRRLSAANLNRNKLGRLKSEVSSRWQRKTWRIRSRRVKRAAPQLEAVLTKIRNQPTTQACQILAETQRTKFPSPLLVSSRDLKVLHNFPRTNPSQGCLKMREVPYPL